MVRIHLIKKTCHRIMFRIPLNRACGCLFQDTDEVDAPVKKRERENIKVPDSKLDKRLQVVISLYSKKLSKRKA